MDASFIRFIVTVIICIPIYILSGNHFATSDYFLKTRRTEYLSAHIPEFSDINLKPWEIYPKGSMSPYTEAVMWSEIDTKRLYGYSQKDIDEFKAFFFRMNSIDNDLGFPIQMDKISYKDFAKTIRQMYYPERDGSHDYDLAKKYILKYPRYKYFVTFDGAKRVVDETVKITPEIYSIHVKEGSRLVFKSITFSHTYAMILTSLVLGVILLVFNFKVLIKPTES